ncbi:Muramoyltetrapeptide carboxypeptidase [Indibacter alkaliphilus LW1]|uniref:Muramoyltetrapeptide carboxypeptidase n=1 Tax=Indibacter alkaliphilus (strain CCUG 57479 / KCTC 22604 / LW1) TaxID=1189612 RepID=S2D182_INDAL|nr:LD-carboxypeptidase [Indibacter alkaliphilus]EOZ92624.1 Muramoyltetrapeptide carboxypeptidase [Indibacter alkaliphilus LW1]
MDKRLFLKTFGLGIGALPLVSFLPKSKNKENTLLPSPLQYGDKVGLISPSAATAERIEFQFAMEALEALGLEVELGKNLKNRRGHLAGTDEERAEDLNEMFEDISIKAVICIRGGSGAARILPLIDYSTIQTNPKPLLGYSDITALHNAIHAKTGLITFHGPNGSGSWNSFNVNQFQKVFFNKELVKFENEVNKGDELIVKQNRIQTIYPGKVSGKILGGNLTVLTALSGTSYLPDFTGSILFIEDIAEDPYKIDRMMSTLMLNGTLSKIKGFIFGQCTNCTPGGGYGSLTLDDILDDYILPLKIPAYKGAMIGHVPKQFIVPVGAEVEMDAENGTFTMLKPIFKE